MKTIIHTIASCFLISVSFYHTAMGQVDTVVVNKYEGFSLKELLNIKIVSVSKKEESLFDAPLSASVITREDILQSGSTSIMEALRLAPGMIVREQSNGNYDIHLRGMDNVPPNAPFDITSNTTTLVMINNRPIYSYLRGGTFWETLPVDINDVEKIEVVRGPAAALYGPNAVNGVINIITRQTTNEGLYLVTNHQAGSLNTYINNVSAGYQSGKWSVIASGNYQHRNRSQTSYFEYDRNNWITLPGYFLNFLSDTVRNTSGYYPRTALSMEKYAGNVFLDYQPADNTSFHLSTGIQHSLAQRVSTENEITPLSTTGSDSRYIDLRTVIKNFAAQLSYNTGTQTTEQVPGNKYDFRVVNAAAEYKFTKGSFSVTPGLNYTNAIYDDTRYSDISSKKGIFNNRGNITTEGISVRSEYSLLQDKLRLVTGMAATRFNYPAITTWSFQFAATYKINEDHLLRGVFSKAPRSSNIFDTYVDQTVVQFPTGNNHYFRVALEGNKELALLTADMYEIGYRGRITSNLSVDVEIFDTHARNFNQLVSTAPYTEINGTDTFFIQPISATNLPLRLHQQGLTVSITWTPDKFTIKPFITWQQTKAKDYYPSNTAYGNGPTIYSGIGNETRLKSTPAIFGGLSGSYALSQKFDINCNAYFYSAQTYYHFSNLLYNDGIRGIDRIKAKLIINAGISYQPKENIRLFCTGRNLLNDRFREFFRTDKTTFMLLAGINYELK